jgi:hypothetical protein
MAREANVGLSSTRVGRAAPGVEPHRLLLLAQLVESPLPYQSGKSTRWLKIKNPQSPAMLRLSDG